MAWRLAKSLEMLRKQINSAHPRRNKSSDGTIGDASHQNRTSDHNARKFPLVDGDVVTAMDITHDPSHGVDTWRIAEILRLGRDPRIKYVISNGRIFHFEVSPWKWRTYTGANSHSHHVHISVRPDPKLVDSLSPWTFESLQDKPAILNRNIIATVWADVKGAYPPYVIDHSKPSVSLPAAFKSPRPRVRVFGPKGSAIGDIADKGPWYDGTVKRPADPYWEIGTRPRAETDPKTNKAGIDLNPLMALLVGIDGKGEVDWEFVD